MQQNFSYTLLLVCVVADLAIASFAEGLMHLGWVSLVPSCGHHLRTRVHRLLDSSAITERIPIITRAAERVLSYSSTCHLVLKLIDLHLVIGCVVSHGVLRMPNHNCAQKARYKQSNAA